VTGSPITPDDPNDLTDTTWRSLDGATHTVERRDPGTDDRWITRRHDDNAHHSYPGVNIRRYWTLITDGQTAILDAADGTPA